MNTLFAQVETGYRHQQKIVRAEAALRLPQTHLKWYALQPEELPVTAAQVEAAQNFLQNEILNLLLNLRNEVGFVIQHRCAKVLILYVCTWRGNNEVWETLYHCETEPMGIYQKMKRQDTSPTFCVWVLPVVLHEQKAWVKYLKSGRQNTDQENYLNDYMNGLV